ncbi:MAG: hypothetical protein HY672_00470 [Chloroflexi bacterium]|nr:hypothetical protein [Chloroflexota bacterium]
MLVISAALVVTLLALAACSSATEQPAQGETTGEQGGATGAQDTSWTSESPQQPYPYGPGGMMGGMMGGWGGYVPDSQPLTLEQAAKAVSPYLSAYGHDLKLKEVMEFAENFYAEVEEQSTGIHAIELLVDKYTGQVYPEMGPNTMWNTKYGMMSQMMGSYYIGGAPTAAMSVTSEQASALAQQFLEANRTGLIVADADAFYGYYTLHTLRDGQVEGMLSVNGYTGAVWYHNWHGPFVGMEEFHD